MANPIEELKRNRFFIEGAPDIPHSSRNHAEDLQEYHLPLSRMHHAHLHDRGIAGGLGVSVTAQGDAVEVQPGVAVDGRGELIALSADGEADISLLEPGEQDRQIAAPFRLGTAGLAGQTHYLTIQFAERLRLTQGAGGKLEHTPWLRLQPVAGDGAFTDDGLGIVLAIVEIDASGIATVRARDPALPHGRQLLGDFTSDLRIRRSTQTTGEVGQDLAAVVTAAEEGGLRISVPEATHTVHMARMDDGPFAAFTVQADATHIQGSLNVQDDQANQGELHVAGSTQLGGTLTVDAAQGRVGIGTPTPAQELEVAGTVKATAFQGDGADLTGVSGTDNSKVTKDGDTMTGPLTIDTAGTALTVLNGKVGIGTATPSRQLEVAGTVKATAFQGDGAGLTRVRGTDISKVAKGGDTMVGTLTINTFAKSAIKVLRGNVGIGSFHRSDPAFQLSLGRSLGTTKLAIYEGNSGYGYGLGVTAGKFRLHVGNPKARFAFLDSAGSKAKEILTIRGSGDLEVRGRARKPGGGSWASLSDRRLKTDIRQLDGALDRLLRLRGVRFQWKDPAEHGDLNGPQIGMIAQEVEGVFPDWVSTTEGGYKLLSISGFEALTVEALRELQAANTALLARCDALEARLKQLKAETLTVPGGWRNQDRLQAGSMKP